MSGTLVHRGPDSCGDFSDGTSPSRPAASRSSTSRRATSRSRTRTAPSTSSRTARSTTTASCAASSSARATASAPTATPRCCRTSTRSTATGFAERLRGMFAIAIWDARRRRLVLARDRFGIKPLYYRAADRELAFASELRALPARRDRPRRAGGVPRVQLDSRAAHDLPRGAEASGRAPARLDRRRDRARALRKAGARRRRSERATTRRSSSRSCAPACATRCAHTSSATFPSASCCPAASTPRSLAALAAQETAEPLRTFSIGFEERSFDELAGARRVAERYGTKHRELVLRPDAALLLPALADAFDEPFADSSALPTYLVSQLAASDVKVALSGEGGDELFGGYYTYAADLLAARVGGLARLARPARRAAAELDREGELRLQGEALRARGPPAAARAAPRLEGDLLARAARRADRPRDRVRPGRPPARALSPRRKAPSCWRACRTSISASTSSTTCS